MPSNYISSQRFIHDELLRRCESAVRRVPELWKQHKKIHPSLLLWPSDGIKTVEGQEHTGVVFMELPEDSEERQGAIKKAVKDTNAFGILVAEQLTSEVRLVFESSHGTRTWRFPIKYHGDVTLLGVPTYVDGTSSGFIAS